jgi:RNA polymerase sigma-70 factor (ECF subfamily)
MISKAEEGDLALITRLSHKERSALTEFYERFQQPVFGYLYRFLGSRELAEDVLQDVMLVVWQKADTFRGRGRVQNWVFGIAHHLAALALRRETSTAIEVDLDLPDGELTLEDDAIRKATAEEITAALTHLTPVHREVLELAFYQDFSCKEIAAIVGIAEGTVKSRLSYARRTLKAVLLCRVERE